MNKDIINQLKKRGKFSLQAHGESMLPLLHPKDLINYQKISFLKIKTNDLVLVFKNNLAFTHRVIYKTKRYLIIKGDNNLESDGKIYPRHVVGKVMSIKRKNKIIDPELIYLIQSTLYFKEIVKIVDIFNKEKIDYVFLKGLPVHLYYEKTHPRRIYQDADVLIEKKDFVSAKKILTDFGYKSVDSSLSPTQKKLKDKIVEISFYKLVNGFPVIFDIHLEVAFMMTQVSNLEALYPQKLIDKLTEELLNNKKQIIINNGQFYILDTPYLILYLSLHFFHHNFKGAFRLQLIDLILRKNYLDDGRLQDSIKKYHLKNFVSPVFFLLKKYYQTPISDLINFINFINFKNLNIFNDEFRIEAGVNRFKNLFSLSPLSLYKRIFVITNRQIWQYGYFSIKSRLNNLLKKKYFEDTLNV